MSFCNEVDDADNGKVKWGEDADDPDANIGNAEDGVPDDRKVVPVVVAVVMDGEEEEEHVEADEEDEDDEEAMEEDIALRGTFVPRCRLLISATIQLINTDSFLCFSASLKNMICQSWSSASVCTQSGRDSTLPRMNASATLCCSKAANTCSRSAVRIMSSTADALRPQSSSQSLAKLHIFA